ncbi:class II aldolase/adducin family protein [Acuticoccus sediminis]|uniref:class II aldolase/adducin family protein n=1 Tax=Acuticoccus sediminis TaxID=2184697 RepID=UPI001CFD5005|nr:class II aldolase/adducin family protein [Acuticoccus sediminis]
MLVKDASPDDLNIKCEKDARIHLTAVYRLLAHYGLDDTIFTHASCRIPGENAFLLNPFGYLFDEITPDSLVKIEYDKHVNADGTTKTNAAGYVIHASILRGRPDLECVIHTHTTAGVAVSSLEDGVLPINQFAIEFHNRIGIHDYEGIAFNTDEGPRLQRDLEGKVGLILRNHGLLTVGASIPAAFYLTYYLEQACRVQMTALASGRQICWPDRQVIDMASGQFTSSIDPPKAGMRMWPAMLRRLDRIDPDWRRG